MTEDDPVPPSVRDGVESLRRDVQASSLTFVPVVRPADVEAAVMVLTSNEWPYHGRPTLSRDEAFAVPLVGDDVVAFLVQLAGDTIGVVRAFDLDDLAVGSPLLDIRIAASHRGHGVGTSAVWWLTDHLFRTHPALHRIEATTRHDNVAMQRVFARCGFRLEGRLLEAWTDADGSRADTWIYAILRREWEAQQRRRDRPPSVRS